MAMTAKDRANIRFQHSTTPDCTSCWIWEGSISSGGYALAFANGEQMPAYRFVYENLRGKLPPSRKLKRRCPNTLCVNPNHYETHPAPVASFAEESP